MADGNGNGGNGNGRNGNGNGDVNQADESSDDDDEMDEDERVAIEAAMRAARQLREVAQQPVLNRQHSTNMGPGEALGQNENANPEERQSGQDGRERRRGD